jgi:hypothetical protein
MSSKRSFIANLISTGTGTEAGTVPVPVLVSHERTVTIFATNHTFYCRYN